MSQDKKSVNLKSRFLTTSIVLILFVCLFLPLIAFLRFWHCYVENDLQRVSAYVDVLAVTGQTEGAEFYQNHQFLQTFSDMPGLRELHIADLKGSLIWSSNSDRFYQHIDAGLLALASQGQSEARLRVAPKANPLDVLWTRLQLQAPIDYYIPFRSDGRIKALIVSSWAPQTVMSGIYATTLSVLAIDVVLFILFFFIMYWLMRRMDIKIREQEGELKNQILRLSNLLTINKNMKNNMQSASSRAVELNEQFLRRIGSDLHDGPAQSIGYAILRLDKVNHQDSSEAFNQEYHTVKEALSGALEEIRDISSGLILPELEGMTLQESLEKVVDRHKKKANVAVSMYLKDLPEEIPFPIQICAYRFIQEGLNNADRHGKASKCRISAFVDNGNLYLSLKDDGQGFRLVTMDGDGLRQNFAKKSDKQLKEGRHLGLMGLVDRIESLGGKFYIDSGMGVGTTIKVSLPLYGGGLVKGKINE